MITIGWGVWKLDLIAGLGLAIGAEAVNEQSNGQSALEVSDAAAAAVAVAPRVTLADIEGAICARYDMTADKAIGEGIPIADQLKILSLCILVMKNGFTIIGKSAPASPENFNAELGRKFAYEDCVRQLWPLMGFALRDTLVRQKQTDEFSRQITEDIRGAT